MWFNSLVNTHPAFLWFVIIGIVYGFIYSKNSLNIFEWNADPDYDDETVEKGPNGEIIKTTIHKLARRKLLEDKRKIISEEGKCAWIIERYWHIFSGIFIGWIFLWILLDLRIHLFTGKPDVSNLNFTDFALFTLGWIGINGRLPTIAHDVQNWFKR